MEEEQVIEIQTSTEQDTVEDELNTEARHYEAQQSVEENHDVDDEIDGEAHYEAAVERIKAQMEEKQNDPYLQIIGNYILEHLAANARHSTRFLNEEKTLSRCWDTVVRYAMQFKSGNAAMVEDSKVFAVVLNYFGCWEGEPFDLPPERPTYTPPVRTNVQTTQANRPAPRPLGPKGKPIAPEQMTLFDI